MKAIRDSNSRSSQESTDCRDASFYMLLYEYLVKTMSLSTDPATCIGYLLFFLITWYLISYVVRFVLWIVWTAVMVILAVLMIRFMATFEVSDLVDMFFQALVVVADMVVAVVARTLTFGLSFFNSTEVQYEL